MLQMLLQTSHASHPRQQGQDSHLRLNQVMQPEGTIQTRLLAEVVVLEALVEPLCLRLELQTLMLQLSMHGVWCTSTTWIR